MIVPYLLKEGIEDISKLFKSEVSLKDKFIILGAMRGPLSPVRTAIYTRNKLEYMSESEEMKNLLGKIVR